MDKRIQYIEQILEQLVKQANLNQFEKQIIHNIQQKKNKSNSDAKFYSQLMMNIVYFQEFKRVWDEVFLVTFSQDKLPTVSFIEQELLAKQMEVRQQLLEKSNDYMDSAQEQFNDNTYSGKMLQIEYAKASIEHSLRIDFITVLAMNKPSKQLLQSDIEELLVHIEQKIKVYSSDIVEKLHLN